MDKRIIKMTCVIPYMWIETIATNPSDKSKAK